MYNNIHSVKSCLKLQILFFILLWKISNLHIDQLLTFHHISFVFFSAESLEIKVAMCPYFTPNMLFGLHFLRIRDLLSNDHNMRTFKITSNSKIASKQSISNTLTCPHNDFYACFPTPLSWFTHCVWLVKWVKLQAASVSGEIIRKEKIY